MINRGFTGEPNTAHLFFLCVCRVSFIIQKNHVNLQNEINRYRHSKLERQNAFGTFFADAYPLYTLLGGGYYRCR